MTIVSGWASVSTSLVQLAVVVRSVIASVAVQISVASKGNALAAWQEKSCLLQGAENALMHRHVQLPCRPF